MWILADPITTLPLSFLIFVSQLIRDWLSWASGAHMCITWDIASKMQSQEPRAQYMANDQWSLAKVIIEGLRGTSLLVLTCDTPTTSLKQPCNFWALPEYSIEYNLLVLFISPSLFNRLNFFYLNLIFFWFLKTLWWEIVLIHKGDVKLLLVLRLMKIFPQTQTHGPIDCSQCKCPDKEVQMFTL